MKRYQVVRIALVAGVLGGPLACNNLSELTGSTQLPAGTVDPSTFANPAGAMAMYENALYTFQYAQISTQSVGGVSGATSGSFGAFLEYALESGVFTDELQPGNLGAPAATYSSLSGVLWDSIDARQVNPSGNSAAVYSSLQNVRGAASLALGALAAYDPAAPPDLRGQLYALRGYSIVMLAEFYCSGVPLSTLTFNGDYTYASPSTSTQLYQAAIVQFDSALGLLPDSTRIMYMARVGEGRALLDLGEYAQAAQAVATVPDNFQYQFYVNWNDELVGSQGIFSAFGNVGATESDKEGGNGMPFRSSGDPRSAAQVAANSPNAYGKTQYVPLKYGGASRGVWPITVADGMEARLIEAEAAYQASDYTTWLNKLNDARGIANSSLPALTDPGDDPDRVTLMFQERAYDLFLTGHRQGDLRRLVRQYGMSQNEVYPTGAYGGGPVNVYGSDVNVPVPNQERTNPYFNGCLSRGA